MRVGKALPAYTLYHKHHAIVLLIHLPLHRTLLDREGGVIVVRYMCNTWRRRPLWRLDRIGLRGGHASTTTLTTFIWTFLLCDLQGYVDLISPARCFASRRSDLGLFLFVLVGKICFLLCETLHTSHIVTTDDTNQCDTSLELQVKSVVARVIFPTKMTRDKYQTLRDSRKSSLHSR
jgi:hypothetical protein